MGQLMKNILRIYKMFYRLLRLKQKQRRELENKYSSMFRIFVSGIKDDYELTKLELSDWKRTAILFEIENPLQLFKILNNKKNRRTEQISNRTNLKRDSQKATSTKWSLWRRSSAATAAPPKSLDLITSPSSTIAMNAGCIFQGLTKNASST